jgi:phage tail sheath protein FI
MSIERGVVASWQAVGSRVVSVSANEPLALVLTSNEVSGNEMRYFDTLQKALAHYMNGRTEQQIATAITAGTIHGNLFKYLVWANKKYDLRVPMVISVAKHSTTAAVQKTNVINAISEIKKAPSRFKIRPDVIGVADFTQDRNIANAVIATCDYLRARSFVDLAASNGSDAITKRGWYGSERITPTYTNLRDWDTLASATGVFSAAFVLSLFRTVIDGSDVTRDTGWSFSLSNKVLPVSDTVNQTEFILGLGDETDNLTQHQITSFIEFQGVRVWNYQTCSADPLLQDARRVRIFDKLTFAVLPAIFPFIDSDRGVAAVKEAKDTIRDFMADMIGKDILLGGIIELDTDLTTANAINQGKFYIKVRTQENPTPVRIAIEFNRESIFSGVVYKRIG